MSHLEARSSQGRESEDTTEEEDLIRLHKEKKRSAIHKGGEKQHHLGLRKVVH